MRYLDFERPLMELERKIEDLEKYAQEKHIDLSNEIKPLREKLQKEEQRIFSNLNPWQKIQLARHPDRPYMLDIINNLMEDFIEIHGDRTFRDDCAIVTGLATFNGTSVALMGHQKGRDTKENLHRNFGMAHPEGFRKAKRLMLLAERFNLPIISFIDSAGAFPGLGAEERGQHLAIAENLELMATLKTPIIVIVTGEGGSGGALAIGVGDHIMLMQNAYYAVCTPEACAAIIWKDRAKAPQAVEYMRITADELLNLGVIDEIIPEPLCGAHRNQKEMMVTINQYLVKALVRLSKMPLNKLLKNRYEKFRKQGVFLEGNETAK